MDRSGYMAASCRFRLMQREVSVIASALRRWVLLQCTTELRVETGKRQGEAQMLAWIRNTALNTCNDCIRKLPASVVNISS